MNYDRVGQTAYAKLVVNKADNNRVVGLHYLGPEAGEVVQELDLRLLLLLWQPAR